MNTRRVPDTCVWSHLRRAARRFDAVFRPLRLTDGQFLAVDALQRPGSRLLASVLPVREKTHAAVEGQLTDADPDRLRGRSPDRRALI